MRSISNLSVTLILLLSLLLITCATTGPGGKTSLILISEGQEIAIGSGMAEELKTTEKELDDTEWQNYLNEIGQKIVKVSDRQGIEYHFTVIESEQINAFAAPGGYIYFYTGLLKEMDTESEMAAVMAHEISHVVARHSVKRIQAAMGVSLAYQLVFGSDGAGEALNAAVSIGMGLTFASYSRGAEREADDYGLQYLVKAGYNPNGAVRMYEKLAAIGGGGQSSFEQLASTHPDTQERISNAKIQIKSMLPLPNGLTDNKDHYQKMKKRLP
jgi:predicted Zn-dependent protease